MHDLLWEKLVQLDGKETAKRANCTFDAESSTYTMPLLGVDFTVDPHAKNICVADDPDQAANFMEQLCILAYLINATDIPAANKLISGDKLDSGQFFFRGPHQLPTGKLEEVFGDEPEMLYETSQTVNAKRCDYGDASIEVTVLPRLPIVFVVWGRDEEFESRGSILFDKTAARQLPLDALGAAVQLTISKITNPVA